MPIITIELGKCHRFVPQYTSYRHRCRRVARCVLRHILSCEDLFKKVEDGVF